MTKLLVTAFSALTVLLGAASVAAPLAADVQGETVAARGGLPGLDGIEAQHNETLVRDEV